MNNFSAPQIFMVWFDLLLEEWFAVEKTHSQAIVDNLQGVTTFHEVSAHGSKEAISAIRPSNPTCNRIRVH